MSYWFWGLMLFRLIKLSKVFGIMHVSMCHEQRFHMTLDHKLNLLRKFYKVKTETLITEIKDGNLDYRLNSC